MMSYMTSLVYGERNETARTQACRRGDPEPAFRAAVQLAGAATGPSPEGRAAGQVNECADQRGACPVARLVGRRAGRLRSKGLDMGASRDGESLDQSIRAALDAIGGKWRPRLPGSATYRATFIEAHGPWPHPCLFCGGEVDGQTMPRGPTTAVVHHVDGNVRNNSPENLAPAHQGCHASYHLRAAYEKGGG